MNRLAILICALALFTPALAMAQYGDDCVDAVVCHVQDAEVVIEHNGAWYNCCPVMEWTMKIDSGTLRIDETEVEGVCDCMCCFDYGISVAGLDPGEWTVVLAWMDYDWPEIIPREEIFNVVIPDDFTKPGTELSTYTLRECYDATTTGIQDAGIPWGMMKSLFR